MGTRGFYFSCCFCACLEFSTQRSLSRGQGSLGGNVNALSSKTGIPRRLNVDVQDVCDIQTISRMSPFYGVTVSVSDLDGSNVREIETLPCQLGTHFDFEITLPHECINVSSQEKQIRFNVFGEDILGNRVHELYDGDNTAAYKINVLKGIGPEAAINNHRHPD